MTTAENSATPTDSTKPTIANQPPNRRVAALMAGVILLCSGIAALAIPWVEHSPRWDWTIRTSDDLTGAEVNADIVDSGATGVGLRKRGERHISIISKPLTGVTGGRPTVEVSLSRAVDPLPGELRIILFWQTEAGGPFRMEEQRQSLEKDGETQVIFTPPVDAAAIYRVGVQVPDIEQIRIGGICMVNSSLRQRASLVIRELSVQETFGSESVNYYKGPNLLGRSLNYHLVGLTMITFGTASLIAFTKRRRLKLRSLLVAAAIPWFAGDLVFTPQLFDRATAESEAHRNMDERSSYAAAYDETTVAASVALISRPIGSKVAVVSEDAITVGHRLAYLAAPHMVLIEKPENADFIVVLGSRASGSPEKLDVRRSDTNEPMAVHMVQQWPGGCLLERTEH